MTAKFIVTDCPGPVLKEVNGWKIRDCDNCILFPCAVWEEGAYETIAEIDF